MTAVIIDDEPACHKDLREALAEQDSHITVIGSAHSMAEGLALIESQQPKLVFLDIDLGDGTAFELLEKSNRRDFLVIFITAFHEFALRAFKFEALHYLTKPIDSEELSEALVRADKYQQQSFLQDQQESIARVNDDLKHQRAPSRLKVKNLNGTHYIPLQQLVCIYTEGSKTIIHRKDGEDIALSKRIKQLFPLFQQHHQLMRIHRSTVINLDYVARVEGTEVVMSTGRRKMYVSTSYASELNQRLGEL